MNSYVTVDDDRLDLIVYRHYGHLKGTVEAVLAVNPTLASAPLIMSSGMLILLPDLAQQSSTDRIVLWGN